MIFPQYLWRIRCKHGTLLLRRGHTAEEAMQKFLTKDKALRKYHACGVYGIGATCLLIDVETYSQNHPWDWLNE